MRRFPALVVAAFAVAGVLAVAGCGHRAQRIDPAPAANQNQQVDQAGTSGDAGSPSGGGAAGGGTGANPPGAGIDPAAVDGELNNLDAELADVDSDLASVDASPEDSD